MGRRTATVAIASLLAVVVVTGCTGADKEKPKAHPESVPPSSRITPSANAEDGAKTQVLEVYDRFRTLQAALEGGDPLDEEALGKVATGRAAALLRGVVTEANNQGVVVRGPQGARAPKVVMTSLTAAPPSVTVEDCIDTSQRVPVYRDTGKPFSAPSQSPRYIKTFIAQQPNPGSPWVIADMRSERDRTC
ncbi:hypothetical protein [Embleya sp. MST-111070]|uniref:hypothetical protein n=1 Tax=Embleya sp. MST-111070 TaxID=3398231 RepID=UPI003F73624A